MSDDYLDIRVAFERAIYRHALAVQVDWSGPRLQHCSMVMIVNVRADLETNVAYEVAIPLDDIDPVTAQSVGEFLVADINTGVLAQLRDNAIRNRQISIEVSEREHANRIAAYQEPVWPYGYGMRKPKSEDELVARIRADYESPEEGRSPEYDLALRQIEAALDTPIGRVHDWRNYVTYIAFELWHELPLSTKLLLFMEAEARASMEHWD